MHQISDPKIAFAFLRPPVSSKSTSSSLFVSYSKSLGQKKDKLVQAVAEAMSHVLETTCVQSWETLRDLLSELCLCLCTPTDPGKPAETSEELKSCVLRCLDALLHAAYGDIIFKPL
ncbi:hypothetical protein KUCAC02_012208 [Chaenocephalus aceratus]|uniref:Uncharacterized protein n=1 Tax=Chaenocephalus aceratus TaxID=36190 RepID=A0ACB9XBP7_CHAAC|nr:hypothetical protein KUCAC02_012208 [Chaenocephalus aceratus]